MLKTKSLELTQRSIRVLGHAGRTAKKLDCPVSFPVYLYAIMWENSGVGGTTLRNAGVGFVDFDYLKSINNILRLMPDQTELLLEKAELAAKNLQDKAVGTEHLLLAILNNADDGSDASRSVQFIIASAKTTVEQLKTEVAIHLGNDLTTCF